MLILLYFSLLSTIRHNNYFPHTLHFYSSFSVSNCLIVASNPLASDS